jgi:hypothetical protein
MRVGALAGSPSSDHCDPASSMLSRAVYVRFSSPSPGMHHYHHHHHHYLRILSLMQNKGYDLISIMCKIMMKNGCQQEVD